MAPTGAGGAEGTVTYYCDMVCEFFLLNEQYERFAPLYEYNKLYEQFYFQVFGFW